MKLRNAFPRTQSRTPCLLKPLAEPKTHRRPAAAGEEVVRGDSNWVPIAATPTRCSTKDKFYWRRRKEGIAALVEDAEEMEVVWEQRRRDVEAERLREVMSSAGWLLFPYHLVVAHFLIEKGYIKIFSISSTEAFLSVTGHHTVSWFFCWCYSLCGDCFWSLYARGFNSYQNVDRRLLTQRDCISPRVAVTQILWRPRGLLVDQFDSKEDLIDALFTSSFIPGYLAPRPATVCWNRFCVDGDLTLFMPPTSAAQTEKNLENFLLFYWAFEPAEDHILGKLFEHGYSDAAAWAKDNPVEEIVKDDRRDLRTVQ